MGLRLTTPPAVEPITLTEAKTHLRVSGTDDDDRITALIAAAREEAETITGRAFITQTWRLTLDRFPLAGPIVLPRPPLQSITSLAYVDSDGASQTWDAANYRVSANNEPGRIEPAYNEVWPTTRLVSEAATVTYAAGYGDAASDVPGGIKNAILLLVERYYDACCDAEKMRRTIESLLSKYKVGPIAGYYGITR